MSLTLLQYIHLSFSSLIEKLQTGSDLFQVNKPMQWGIQICFFLSASWSCLSFSSCMEFFSVWSNDATIYLRWICCHHCQSGNLMGRFFSTRSGDQTNTHPYPHWTSASFEQFLCHRPPAISTLTLSPFISLCVFVGNPEFFSGTLSGTLSGTRLHDIGTVVSSCYLRLKCTIK